MKTKILFTLSAIVFSAALSVAQTADVSQYLMYFPFEDNLTDASGKNVTLNPKVPASTVDTYQTGQFGKAALFNDKPYITANSTFDAGASFSMMMWVNFNSLSSAAGSPKLIHQEDQGPTSTFLAGRPLQIATSNVTFNTSFGERVINSPSSPVVGTWTHIAVVMDKAAGTSVMYVDGVLVMTMDNSVGPNIVADKTNNAQLSIGVQKASNTTGLLDGLVDDFVITSEVLDQATIANIIANGAAFGGAPATCSATTTFDGTNWDNGVPDANTAAIIAGDYNLGAFTSCDLTVNASVTLDLGTAVAVVHGDLVNNGTILASTGDFEFAGSQSQTISGNSFTIGDLILNNSGTDAVAILTDIDVSTRLELLDGFLDTTSGSLTLKSNVSNTAFVDVAGTGAVVGDVTVEKFIPGKRAFRFVASSVTTTSSISDNWQQGGLNPGDVGYEAGFGTHITGSTSGSNGFDATLSGNPSLFSFDNVNQLWPSEGISNTDMNTLDAGTPYRLFVRGSRAIDLTSNTETADDTSLRATGELQIGDFDVTADKLGPDAGDFNLVGNPYQAPVNMNSVLTASSNINTGSYYVWDPQIGERGTYILINLPAGTNTSGSSIDEFLQPGNAAFVSTAANGPANVLFQEANKSVIKSAGAKSNIDNNVSIIGQLYRNDNGVVAPTVQDSFGIYFDSDANDEVDLSDALKLYNQDESITVQNGENRLAMENRQLPSSSETIQLNHYTYRTTNYQYKLTINGITDNQVILEDAFLGTSTLLNDGANYIDFSVDPNDASSDVDRFSLKIEKQTLGLADQELTMNISLFPNPVTADTAEISITGAAFEAQPTISLYNIAGQKLNHLPVSFSAGNARLTGLSQLATGAYFITVTAGEATQTVKFIKQ